MVLIGLHAWLEKRIGRPLPRLAQAFFVWFAAYGVFRYIISPPLPTSILYPYIGMVTIGIIVFLLSTDRSVGECRQIIVATLHGETRAYRVTRAMAFVLIPLAGFLWTKFLVTPTPVGEPIELRVPYPAPPRTIEVHGKTFVITPD